MRENARTRPLPLDRGDTVYPAARRDIHNMDCDCDTCAPFAFGVERPLSGNAIAVRMAAGLLIGNAIAFIVDPAGSWATLSTAFKSLVGL